MPCLFNTHYETKMEKLKMSQSVYLYFTADCQRALRKQDFIVLFFYFLSYFEKWLNKTYTDWPGSGRCPIFKFFICAQNWKLEIFFLMFCFYIFILVMGIEKTRLWFIFSFSVVPWKTIEQNIHGLVWKAGWFLEILTVLLQEAQSIPVAIGTDLSHGLETEAASQFRVYILWSLQSATHIHAQTHPALPCPSPQVLVGKRCWSHGTCSGRWPGCWHYWSAQHGGWGRSPEGKGHFRQHRVRQWWCCSYGSEAGCRWRLRPHSAGRKVRDRCEEAALFICLSLSHTIGWSCDLMTHHTPVLGWIDTAVEGDEAAADERLWVWWTGACDEKAILLLHLQTI